MFSFIIFFTKVGRRRKWEVPNFWTRGTSCSIPFLQYCRNECEHHGSCHPTWDLDNHYGKIRDFRKRNAIDKIALVSHIFPQVPQGQIGLAFDRGQPVLFPPGLHQWDSQTLKFEKCTDLCQPVIEMGPYTLLTVDEG